MHPASTRGANRTGNAPRSSSRGGGTELDWAGSDRNRVGRVRTGTGRQDRTERADADGPDGDGAVSDRDRTVRMRTGIGREHGAGVD